MSRFLTKPPPRRAVSPDDDTRIAHAINEIFASTGDRVSVRDKAKGLLKFGRNASLGTSFETIWEQGGDETLPTSNAIDTISSRNAGDTGTVTVEGHTLSGSDLTFVVQNSTLNGQNKVVLGTALYRASRIYNTGSVDWAGDIYVYEDDTLTGGVPNTAAKIHLKGTGAPRNQSEKCATSLSFQDYLLVTHFYGSVSTKTSANVEFEFQIREFGKVYRTRAPGFAVNSSGGADPIPFDPWVIVPKNADCRIIGKSSSANTECEAGFSGYLAIVT